MGLVRAGELARKADLRDELEELRARGLPVLALMTTGDGVIPRAAFEALCSALGTEGRAVPGKHSWLLAEPDSFDEVLANVVEVAVARHQAETAPTRAADIARALQATKVPRRVVRELLDRASPLWLMSAPPGVLASDLALCHPRFGAGEVRAVARPIESLGAVRLTVVAGDRRGLLADTAGVLATHGHPKTAASAMTWTEQGLALHALSVANAAGFDPGAWARLGDDLRASATADVTVRPGFTPSGRAMVSVDGTGADQTLVRVTANDQIGLLWAICQWFADRAVSIDSVNATTNHGVAQDVFLVRGPVRPRRARTSPEFARRNADDRRGRTRVSLSARCRHVSLPFERSQSRWGRQHSKRSATRWLTIPPADLIGGKPIQRVSLHVMDADVEVTAAANRGLPARRVR